MTKGILFRSAIVGVLSMLTVFAPTASANSNTVSYQGVLRDAALSPVADSTYQMRFSIFAVASGGASVWGPETQSVATRNGMFSVYLGSGVSLGTVFADNAALWLQIEVDFGGGAGFEVYNPRVPLASVPYAQKAVYATNAGNADTLDGSDFTAHNADAAAHPALQTPPGVLMPYAGAAAPGGWLLCAGQAVSRATYAALFAAVGTAYGIGDGSTTFNVPDLRGRIPLGLDNMGGTSANRVTAAQADTRGGAAGAETHQLSVAEMPAHNHGVNDPGHAHTYRGYSEENLCVNFGSGCNGGNWYVNYNTTSNTTGITIGSAGSGVAHNNMQPYIAVNYIIKY